MASLSQWTAWREEYLDGLRQIIDDAPFKTASFMFYESTKQKRVLDIDNAKKVVCYAIENGHLFVDDPWYSFDVYALSWVSESHYWYSEQELINAAKPHSAELKSLFNSFDGYYSFVGWFVNMALLDACRYYSVNNPLKFKKALVQFTQEAFGLTINLSYCRLKLNELYGYFCGMAPYGLYNLLADIKCPYSEEIFEAVQREKYKTFLKLCEKYKIDLTEVSEITGCLMNSADIKVSTAEYASPITTSQEFYSMCGVQEMPLLNRQSKCFRPDLLGQLFPFEMSEDEAFRLTCLANDLSGLFLHIDGMDNDERREIDRVLDNPIYTNYIKLAQFCYIARNGSLPPSFSLLLSSDEQALIGENIFDNQKRPNGIAQQKQDCYQCGEGLNVADLSDSVLLESKNLASRWMTEPYQRMSDDVLVEVISKNIWPRLINQVDELKWEPKKRELPTFQKTKNQLAACILFHALELAKIAKLPKQEDQGSSYDGLYGEEDRALTGVYSTSKMRAGVASTKKKYNDTLPLGYMEVLGLFIKESEMPGRTTSRTYLKLLNKWVKKDLEGLYDSVDSKVKAQLFIAEAKEDLGPQLYLLTDNKGALRTLLKGWKEMLPPLFNIPI